MSKSAMVTRTPCELRGTFEPEASNTVRWTAPHKPTGSGFSVGVTVTIHGFCAKAKDGTRTQAVSTNSMQQRRSDQDRPMKWHKPPAFVT